MGLLFISSEIANSLFRIYGKDEDTLTKAMGYFIASQPEIARDILKNIGIKHLSNFNTNHTSNDFTVRLQYHRQEGITDIEIKYKDDYHCIIEAKINNKFPTDKQLLKYIHELHNSPAKRRILSVLNDDRENSMNNLSVFRNRMKRDVGNIETNPIGWDDITRILSHHLNLDHDNYFVNQLINFMNEDFYMTKYYDYEVWVCPVSEENIANTELSFMNIAMNKHIYFHPVRRNRKKCLYFAPKYHSQIKYIMKIQSSYVDVPKNIVAELANVKQDWPSNEHTIFKLGNPIQLPHVVRYSGRGLTYVSLEDLLIKDNIDRES